MYIQYSDKYSWLPPVQYLGFGFALYAKTQQERKAWFQLILPMPSFYIFFFKIHHSKIFKSYINAFFKFENHLGFLTIPPYPSDSLFQPADQRIYACTGIKSQNFRLDP